MSTEIWVAIIGAAGAIIAAGITSYFAKKQSQESKPPNVSPKPMIQLIENNQEWPTRRVGTRVDQIGTIGGRRVKLATGRTEQTVNVFDSSNQEGYYEEVYRFKETSQFVTSSLLVREASTLQQLDTFLVNRGAHKDGPRTPQ